MSMNHRVLGAGSAASISIDSTGSHDDRRVASVLAGYLADLEAGKRPSREQLLERHSEIALELADCLDIVEFVHFAAATGSASSLPDSQKAALPPDTILGEYRLVREIGRGGMGIVYEAEQVSLGRRVALKVLSEAAALDPLKLQRFRVETQAVAQLHHPHIVPIFAVGSDRGTHHYAMQYIDGPTLADVIHQQRRLGEGQAGPPCEPKRAPLSAGPIGPMSQKVRIGRGGQPAQLDQKVHLAQRAFRALARLAIQAAEALDHAHAMGILHRDIKPSNLLVDPSGNLWVTDFGLARFQDEPGVTRTGDLLGTLRYIAPELVLGHSTVHDPRSDIYSLAVTFYEVLTLRPVFDGRDRQALLRQIGQEEPTPPRRIESTIPRDLETIVLKAMDKEPSRRYATARAFADDLARFLEDKPIRALRVTPVERAAKWARRHRAVLGVAATVAFLALAIATPLLWWEQRNTASMYQKLRRAVQQRDWGIEEMMRLSDELTTKGMARYVEACGSPGAVEAREEFFREAVHFYDRLVREYQIPKPMRALAYKRLGFARMLGLHDPQAESDFQRSLTLYEELLAASPRDRELRDAIADVEMNRSLAWMMTGRSANAQVSIQRATSIDDGLAADFPNDSTFLDHLADRQLQIASWMDSFGLRVQAEQKRRELFAFYERRAGSGTGSPTLAHVSAAAYHHLGRTLSMLGGPREQQEAMRRALELKPHDAALENDLAWSLVRPPDAPPSDSAEAIELAKRAVAATPTSRIYWRTLGLAYLRAGQWPPGAEAVKESIELQSQGGDASDYLLMAMISWRRGQKESALDWYIRALNFLLTNPEPDASLLSLRAETERLLGRSTPIAPGPKM
jgi:serine/threonine protein kinase